jgi:hypothetical protein
MYQRLLAAWFGKKLAIGKFGLLADIEGRDGPMVAHYAGPHFATGTFFIVELCEAGCLDFFLHRQIGHGLLHSETVY